MKGNEEKGKTLLFNDLLVDAPEQQSTLCASFGGT
jgi:hypothetical protein